MTIINRFQLIVTILLLLSVICVNSALKHEGYVVTLSVGHQAQDERLVQLANAIPRNALRRVK